MDIGDPSEIPATRKKLPSMQELGAFDVELGPSGAAQPVPSAAPAVTRPAPTAEQLRQALAKADPDTRRKLMRLIAGGQAVQQVGSPAAADGLQRRSLVIQRDPPAARQDGRAASGTAEAPPAKAPASARAKSFGASVPPRRHAEQGERPLMQIDANTELLDAAAPTPTPAQRQAGLQAQVDAALQDAAAPRHEPTIDPAAHKVLFPAYDPQEHGGSVHSPVRRRKDAPIEGHFPAPRQPFQATYRHADGRPMTPEENKVEEVLQAQRCDETLSVLAREGVNGLLLSPRDLDAAVANGLLPAETAATLWKTWAALRPVIHVINDEPIEAKATTAEAQPETVDGPVDNAPAAAEIPLDEPTAEEPPSIEAPTVPMLAPEPIAAAPAELKPPPTAPERRHEEHDSVMAATLPLGTTAALPAPRSPRWPLLRLLGWAFVAFCVVSTSARLVMWAWLRWGHLWVAA